MPFLISLFFSKLIVLMYVELRTVAIGMMLLVASAIGSVEYVVSTVNALTRGDEALSTAVTGILEGNSGCAFFRPGLLLLHGDINFFVDFMGIKTELILLAPTAKVTCCHHRFSGF